MNSLYARVNDAVRKNPPSANGRTADIHITEDGSDFYYAWCATLGFTGIVILGCSLTKRRTDRIFFYLCAAINMTACIAYYTMGSNLGMTPIEVEFNRPGPRVRGSLREVFWVRYVDWFITTPLLLLDLLLMGGMPLPTIAFTLFMDETMIIMGLVGAVTDTDYKWGFFAFGCAAMFYVFWTLAWQGRKYAKHLGSDIHRAYMFCGVLTMLVWMCYPIAWGVCEGGNIIAPDSEAVFYGILDLVAKPIFSIALLVFHRSIDPARLGLKFRDYDDDLAVLDDRRIHNGQHKEETAPSEGVRISQAAEGTTNGTQQVAT